MRLRLALLLPVLVLAACNRPPNLDRPDGSFDRAAWFDLNKSECVDRMRRDDPLLLPLMADRLCGCIADRIIRTSTDADLRGFNQNGSVPDDRLQAARRQCGIVPGQPLPPYGAIPEPGGSGFVPDEPPPPEEPPPSMSGGTPPPLGAPPPGGSATTHAATGPDAGTGASAPGGTRARIGSLGNYITQDDYPAAALRANQQGRVSVTVDISPEGHVTGCQITESSGSAALDSTTCRIMRSRARYTPARNPRGVAVADRDRASVTWALPEG